ncbi:sigma-70 family RNA polymerase sigma factor [Neorhodopirellula lusitana]|uniref:sigma-70 family RNA polymerase sigma factor n=1 Tax=Neorhodopirellula lusitana TaxID=445327 RepID=UPI0024B66B26|nr:sigma-70 family RNA polymerase sigma factor [Neorhodopirellula lusitana]
MTTFTDPKTATRLTKMTAELDNSNAGSGGNHANLVSLLTQHQGELRGFILSAVGDANHAADILQRTNLKIWENADSFRTEAPFLPWAFTIANYEVLSFFRDRGREQVAFYPDIAESLMKSSRKMFDDWAAKQEALNHCIRKLEQKQTEVIRLRYSERIPLATIATQTGRTTQGVKSLLLRTRQKLRDCIQLKLSQEH